MQARHSADSYGAIAQGLHWITVALVVLAWALGTFLDSVPRGPTRVAAHFVHSSAGIMIMAVLIARLAWRVADPAPYPASTFLGVWGDRAGRVAHLALYILLAAVPIVGIVLQFARGDALPILGLFEIASPWASDRAFSRSVKEAHEMLANILLILAVLHALAALAHHWLLKNRTLVRMLPWSANAPPDNT
jgi:cytochrome b561